MEPIVIVGFGTGAIGAVRAIMSNNRDQEVVIVERRNFDTYSPCGMPYVVEGLVEHDALKHEFPGGQKLRKLLGAEAISIDRKEKKLYFRDASGEQSIFYSKLILDTGSRPIIPPVDFEKTLMNRGIYTFGKPEDVDTLLAALSNMKKVVVVGAGAIGLELAQALAHREKEVSVIDMMPHPMPNSFDPDMAKLVLEHLPEQVEVHLSTPLEKISGIERVEAVTAGSKEIPADAVVLSVGVAPETGIAEDAGLEVSKLGIVVDRKMQTIDPDIYAVGDCIQSICGITGDPTASRIAPPALQQGRVAGLNAVGLEASYKGSMGAFVTAVGDYEFAAVGLTSSGIQKTISAKVTIGSKPSYMDSRDIVIKLLSGEEGRIMGAQVCGPGAAALVNRIALAIESGFTAQKLAECEIAYCPPVNDIFDPVTTAAEVLARKIARRRK